MRPVIQILVVAGLTVALRLPTPSFAQADHVVGAARTSETVVVDGLLDPEEWAGAARVHSFIQFEPQRGDPALEPTEAYILYDEVYVYFGFRCFDSQPDKITAQLTQRDADLLTDDAVIIVIDTFHDRRSAYFFATNPLGTQSDGRVTDNGRVVENTWDATWTSAASRSDEGWTAEVAIPLSTLRFRPGVDASWGLNVGRTSRRLLETSFWAGPLEERYRISQYGTLEGLDLEGAQRKYEVIPYVLGNFQEGEGSDVATGLDLRYALSPKNVVTLTFNPDFATIEADQEQVNLTRFELGLAEKRQFFLEGSEQYRQRIQTFYSRRIADIRVGAKMLGRGGDWQYSLLTAQSDPIQVEAGSLVRESANYSVFRLQPDIIGSSTLALMASNRSLGGSNSGSVGLDTTLYFTDTIGFTGQLIRSHGPTQGGKWAWFIRPARDTAMSHLHFRYTNLGEAFADDVNAIGFIRDDNRREMDSAFTRRFWPRSGALERVEYDSNYNIYWSQANVLRSWEIVESLQVDLRNRWSGGVSDTSEYKLFEKKFRNHKNGVNVGYNTREFQSVSVRYEAGRNFDSDFKLLGASARRKITNELSLEYELSRLWLDPGPGNRFNGYPCPACDAELQPRPFSQAVVPDEFRHRPEKPPGRLRLAVQAPVRHHPVRIPARDGSLRRTLRAGEYIVCEVFLRALRTPVFTNRGGGKATDFTDYTERRSLRSALGKTTPESVAGFCSPTDSAWRSRGGLLWAGAASWPD